MYSFQLTKNIISVLNYIKSLPKGTITEGEINFAKRTCPDLNVPDYLYEEWNIGNVSTKLFETQLRLLLEGQL
jgi:hypothetical protein